MVNVAWRLDNESARAARPLSLVAQKKYQKSKSAKTMLDGDMAGGGIVHHLQHRQRFHAVRVAQQQLCERFLECGRRSLSALGGMV